MFFSTVLNNSKKAKVHLNSVNFIYLFFWLKSGGSEVVVCTEQMDAFLREGGFVWWLL